jgi:predicted DNA-binding protein
MTEKKATLVVRIPAEMRERLERKAAEEERTVSSLVRLLLKRALEGAKVS